MATAKVTYIIIPPVKNGKFDFQIVTDAILPEGWVRPAHAAWFTMACVALATGRRLEVEYSNFSGTGDDAHYDVTSMKFEKWP